MKYRILIIVPKSMGREAKGVFRQLGYERVKKGRKKKRKKEKKKKK